MKEYVKYNCHIMAINDVGNKTPEIIMNEYLTKRVNDTDYVFDGVDCIVLSTKYSSGRSSIVTNISRKDDYNNENICKQ